METRANVYERVSDANKKATSKRSRVIVFILSFVFPVGIHNFYLGYHIKALVQVGIALFLLLFTPPFIFFIVAPFYIAWITSEGLIYLLWYKVKDGDDFRFYDINNPPKPKKNKALILAFLLPFGLHNIYLGNLKRGIVEWGFVVVIISIEYIYQIITAYIYGLATLF
jgi:TM2 domain-containing membrane protein YozV